MHRYNTNKQHQCHPTKYVYEIELRNIVQIEFGNEHLELDFILFSLFDIIILLSKHIAPSILLPLFFRSFPHTYTLHSVFLLVGATCTQRHLQKKVRLKEWNKNAHPYKCSIWQSGENENNDNNIRASTACSRISFNSSSIQITSKWIWNEKICKYTSINQMLFSDAQICCCFGMFRVDTDPQIYYFQPAFSVCRNICSR